MIKNTNFERKDLKLDFYIRYKENKDSAPYIIQKSIKIRRKQKHGKSSRGQKKKTIGVEKKK